MFNLALSLLTSLQAGARIKQSFERSLRQAAIAVVAAIVLLAAAAFGLVAAYHALISVYGFSPAAAAGILAGVLALLGIVILLIARAPVHRTERDVPQTIESAGHGLGLVDQGLGKAMQQTGPLTFLAIAFVAGILAGRRR
jgi:hypothetical protein